MKILLVDDDEAILRLFSQILTKGSHTVVTASTGKEALEKVKSEKPELVFLDEMLPDSNGNELLTTIKQDPFTKHIPVAMLSNFSQDDLIQEAIQKGATDYILKYQIEPEELLVKVKQIIREHTTK